MRAYTQDAVTGVAVGSFKDLAMMFKRQLEDESEVGAVQRCVCCSHSAGVRWRRTCPRRRRSLMSSLSRYRTIASCVRYWIACTARINALIPVMQMLYMSAENRRLRAELASAGHLKEVAEARANALQAQVSYPRCDAFLR